MVVVDPHGFGETAFRQLRWQAFKLPTVIHIQRNTGTGNHRQVVESVIVEVSHGH